jgi:hypothetical protein
MTILEKALSPGRRIRALLALLAGLSGTVFVSTLWWTEPGPLPGRTHLAFALFTAICLAWTGYGGWMLARRVPLFATDRVIAGRLALTASAATTTLTTVLTIERGGDPAGVLAIGAATIAAAVVLLVRAHRRRAELLRRKQELTR